jgi:hypothetical protein
MKMRRAGHVARLVAMRNASCISVALSEGMRPFTRHKNRWKYDNED